MELTIRHQVMTHILQTDQQGSLHLPPEVLGDITANRRYQLERQGEVIILRPEPSAPFWQQATPQQRADRWRTWATRHPHNATPLADAALHRDRIYDE